jgi:hypothetical protein
MGYDGVPASFSASRDLPKRAIFDCIVFTVERFAFMRLMQGERYAAAGIAEDVERGIHGRKSC